MTRFVNPSNQSAAEGRHVDWVVLVDMDFSSGHARVFNGVGQLSFNGNTYDGIGTLGNIEAINESAEVKPDSPLVLTLSGIDPAYLAYAALRSEYFNRPVRVDVALFNEQMQIITPIEGALWEGWMDTMTAERSEGQGVITLTCESRLSIWSHSVSTVYSDEHHQLMFPGDLFFDHIDENKDKEVYWGGQRVQTAAGGARGGGGRNTQQY